MSGAAALFGCEAFLGALLDTFRLGAGCWKRECWRRARRHEEQAHCDVGDCSERSDILGIEFIVGLLWAESEKVQRSFSSAGRTRIG